MTFEAEVQPVSIVRGKVNLEDTLVKIPIDAIINVKNLKTNEQFTFKANSKTGKYIMALKEGEYELNLVSSGYKEVKEKFRVGDVGANRPEFEKNFLLKK
jgi:hypothetical protein